MSSPVEASDTISLSKLASQSSRQCHTQLSTLLKLLSHKVRLLCISIFNTFKYLIRINRIPTLLTLRLSLFFLLCWCPNLSYCNSNLRFLYIAIRMTQSASACFSNTLFNLGICCHDCLPRSGGSNTRLH